MILNLLQIKTFQHLVSQGAYFAPEMLIEKPNRPATPVKNLYVRLIDINVDWFVVLFATWILITNLINEIVIEILYYVISYMKKLYL